MLLFWNIILSLACIQPCQVLGRLGTHLVGSTELVVQVVAGASPILLLTLPGCLAFGTLVGCGRPGSPGSICLQLAPDAWLRLPTLLFKYIWWHGHSLSHMHTHTPQEDCLFMYLCIFVCEWKVSSGHCLSCCLFFFNTYCRIVFPRLKYIAVHAQRHVHFKYQQTYCDRSN